ncbi:MAG: methyl-accepting chemotaxis protein [Treponema sp.]|jgi:methyl-accepting chemotaxis protein|nr:methyl-accepting chemotaxis protein [Treponema sp.]
MKLKTRLTAIFTAMLIVVVAVISSVLLIRSRISQIQSAEENMENIAGLHARDLDQHYEKYLDTLENMADVMNSFRGTLPGNRWEIFRTLLQGMLENNTQFLSVYGFLQPGIADAPPEQGGGAFNIYFIRQSSGITVQRYPDAAGKLGSLNFRARISDPRVERVDGVEVLAVDMESIVSLGGNGEAVGILGITVTLNYTQDVITDIRPYGNGRAALYSANGTIVAHPSVERIGLHYRDVAGLAQDQLQRIDQAFKDGKPVQLAEELNIVQCYPFYIGDAPRPWIIMTMVPNKTVLAGVNALTSFTIILAAAAIVIMTAITYAVSHRITGPIVKVALTLKDISEGEGDLTKSIPVRGKDEIADLGQYFNRTLEKIRALVLTIKQQAVSLLDIGNKLAGNMTETAAAMNEITSNIQNIKSRVINQSASVTETNATMEQITVNIDKLNGNVEKQGASVAKSSSAIEEMIANIQSVTGTLSKNAEGVQELLESAEVGRFGLQEVATDIQEIARESEGLLEINAVMENISSQTNLLSMNAAIEAAHAGEAGKGFAVVADEIRKLAENSGEQSKTISAVLKKIKDAIDKITRSTNSVLTKFEHIDTGVKVVSDQEENIRAAMEEQSVGSQQILEVIGQLNEITQMVQAGSDEMLEGSREVITEGRNLEVATQEITSGINEMVSGVNEVNSAVNHINDISGQNKESIDVLVEAVSRFKVEEN